ncbi:glutamate synthase large subunit [Rhizosphaericola mali]|uniref:Glutamate synthase [NADPH] large chain n=1 Tax=Rhizosphaericola mali TaxID=2545455 RepID=A0A5P2G0C9_9BACT|nr:glutamate synthase large subunit [Rhizosphaericola mali]QES87282.1 glutamate synthase large subunit [Rhizosphaericola mali]
MPLEPIRKGLYDPSFEHDACGVGFVADIHGHKSHKNVEDALTVLENMEHRGASGFEFNTGDGAGIMIQLPHEFFFDECIKLGVHLPAYSRYGVGVLFFPKEIRLREECREIFNRCAEQLGLEILLYRQVPVNQEGIGSIALSVEPEMEHVFIACPDYITDAENFERKLFVLKNYASHLIANTVKKDEVGFYIASMSYRTIVYKGQFTSHQVRSYFPDLNNKRLVSSFGLVHSRFATNTFPSWGLAQPFRYIAHNGEINTLQGNLNWLKSGEKGFVSSYFTKEELDMIRPIVGGAQSDSASLDNMVELLHLSGRSLPHVLMMLVPEAWDGNEQMDPLLKDFYEYNAALSEPWDGPASIAFTDGKIIGATLDRNGLRPSRYCITKEGRIILASESGTLPVDPESIVSYGKLQPGKMFVVDMEKGIVIDNDTIKAEICKKKPYGEWLTQYKIRLEELPEPRVMFTHLSHSEIIKFQKAYGYTQEDLKSIILPMAIDGKEPLGAMGVDVPLAVLSDQPQHLSSYFKQLFAQVTNPPIDPIRERLVMSLATFVGNSGNLLEEDALACHTLVLKQPVLTNKELEKLRSIDTGIFQAKTLQMYFRANGEAGALKAGIERLCRYSVDAVNDGFEVIVLSDRAIDSEHAAIPSLLAVSAVHHHLIRKGLRGKVGLVVEAGDIWETHHFACLLGFGATAINPYLAFSSIRMMKEDGRIDSMESVDSLFDNYIHAVCEGLFKIFSKMGISTLQSYQGAQIFEILGIKKEVVERYFTGAVTRFQGIGLDEIAKESLYKHQFAFPKKEIPVELLPVGGLYQWRRKGEAHLFNPTTIHLLQHSTRTNDYSLYKKYAKAINDQEEKAITLRSLLEFVGKKPSISIDEVEPAESIYHRFATGAMSFGSISWEAHTTLAIAMNRIGAKSNTGEGGEDESRYQPMENGDSMRSAIKQVASARFGVTSYYLTEADELQIKMAQGAKPGEGGQLPGFKVDEWIGKTRHSTPGVGLISPPPHHDIYSIEDLAQLIYDLKNANRKARINVKLVSKSGVGTIAAGVVKAKADVVLISGFDGGTGASPQSSIKHAGLPWELGLAETHQTLVMNKLRSRVVVQADGQMKTGRDLAVAALLGAEEWGVATAALVVEGCIMMRKCHLNTCPVGIATQDEELRKRFTGAADHVVNYINFMVQELREIMAELGYRTVNEMIGQVDSLKLRDNIAHWKYKHLDLSPILYKQPDDSDTTLYHTEDQDHALEDILDWQMVKAAMPALEAGQKVSAAFPIRNVNRTVGTLLSNEITKLYKDAGLPEDTIKMKFFGTAGQSFGSFAAKGLTLELEGDGNDYFGKGLSGAKVIVYPSKKATFKAEENIIIGNTAFYGATSGEAFVRGKAGERFCVRNSGAKVVVEGLGAHGCEYMTGGIVVVLGAVSKNFGAGMSGGIAYVYDVNNELPQLYNPEMVDLDPVIEQEDIQELATLLEKHAANTESPVADFLLNDLENQLKHFVKVFPREYKKVLAERKKKELSIS